MAGYGGGGARTFTRLTFHQTELLPDQKFNQSERFILFEKIRTQNTINVIFWI